MRIAFFGTPDFAVPSLDLLVARGETVVAVVTQPDRPRGRSHSTLVPSPVKRRAFDAGLAVLQPERPTGDGFVGVLTAARLDLGVVVAYGHLLKPAILAIPRLGMINLHASLLPRWRGAAPIQWSILGGDRETGISVMQMEAGLDSGPVIDRVTIPIRANETGGELTGRLAGLAATALGGALDRLASGPVAGEPQDSAGVTLAPKIDREVTRIRWEESAEQVARRIRAFDPTPGAWTSFGGTEIKLFGPTVRGFSGPPGSVVVAGPELAIAGGEGSVVIAEVQPAGKTRMRAADWVRGHPSLLGQRFG